MAILLEATYAKKIGLPEYSSHQFSLTVRREVTGLEHIHEAGEDLYHALQASVDKEIRHTGYLPGKDTREPRPARENNGNGSASWQCSDKQKELILRIIRENGLQREDITALARERFGKPVFRLNKMEASGLIDELLEVHGGSKSSQPRRNGAYAERRAS